MSEEEKRISAKSMKIAESFFGTEKDPDQIPIGEESHEKLLSLHKSSIVYELDEKGDPISWVILVPTTESLMNDFLEGKINERELFEKTTPGDSFNALYLCSVFTVPEHRKKGLAMKLFKKAIADIVGDKDFKYFAWPYSIEGGNLIKKLEKDIGVNILIKR